MKVTILGSGASVGTPAAGGFWGACDPLEPRNERTRASILVEEGGKRILVDATYDLRIQLNRNKISDLDAVLLSHVHSDHINGIDDLRTIAFRRPEKKIDVFSNKETLEEMKTRFPYLFLTGHPIYKPFIHSRVVETVGRFTAAGVEVESFAQDHGEGAGTTLGFRFGDFAYSVDVLDLSEKSLKALKGVETWVVDAACYHGDNMTTHANLKRVMGWVDLLKPKMTYLTVLPPSMDYKTLCAELPPHVRPVWDGMEIESGMNCT
jgi:phosphoribosyl 1,2-cyclic phosphate phosphodiesterase